MSAFQSPHEIHVGMRVRDWIGYEGEIVGIDQGDGKYAVRFSAAERGTRDNDHIAHMRLDSLYPVESA